MDKRRFRLFAGYIGPNWDMDYGLEISLAFFLRGDLMTRRDEGRLIPCAFAFRLVTGQSAEAKMDQRLDGWIFWPRFRCEAGEIAVRLAGANDLSRENDRAMAAYRRDRIAAKRTPARALPAHHPSH